MKRCRICGHLYQDSSEICLVCNISLNPIGSTSKVKNNTFSTKEIKKSPVLEKKIESDFIGIFSKKVAKASLQHPFNDINSVKQYFTSQTNKDFTDGKGFSINVVTIDLDQITLKIQIFILSNVQIIESTRNAGLNGSHFYLILHIFDNSNLEIVKKQLIGIDKFVEEHNKFSNLKYPIAIIGLQNSNSHENTTDKDQKSNFQFDLEKIVSNITGLEKRFIIKYFDFTASNSIDFKELGNFYFEKFVKDQKVPDFN